jgi:hypothetical protein
MVKLPTCDIKAVLQLTIREDWLKVINVVGVPTVAGVIIIE